MELEVMKKLIKRYEPMHMAFVRSCDIAERYYRNRTDVLFQQKKEKKEDEEGHPLRNADNRIPRSIKRPPMLSQRLRFLTSGTRKLINRLWMRWGTNTRKTARSCV